MVAAAPLGDVVEQHGDIEHPPRGDLPEDRGRDRVVLLELAALDRREQADRADRMLVDRIMMVHVELHLRDDAAEVGNEAAEHAGLVHPAQHQSRADGVQVSTSMNKALARGSSRTVAVDQTRVAGRRRASPSGWISSRSRAASANSSSRRTGSARKKSSDGDRDPPAVEHEAAEPLGPAADRRKREAEALLAELLVELGEEQAGQVADRLRVEEIELHEPLDRGFPRPVGVIHDLGDARLIFEAQPLLGAPGEQMQVAAHRPEEALGAVEAAELGGGQQPRADEVRGPFDAVDIFADPVERVEVAQGRPCRP